MNMKKFSTIVMFLSVTLALNLLLIPKAGAVSFSFAGGTHILDSDSDGFSELLNFDPQIIFNSDPFGDNILFNNTLIDNLTLDGTFTVNGVITTFYFNPTYYVAGFKVNDGVNDLLVADLQALTLDVNGGAGDINSQLLINLFNIQVTPAGLAIGSTVLNQFNLNPAGIATMTLQYTSNLALAILSGSNVDTTDSGTAFTANPVPEPATILIIGIGLVAVAGYKRIYK